jgi:hypothetical protein
MNEFNIKRYTCINIGSLQLPICISIEKIKDSEELSFEYSDDKIIFYNEGGEMQVCKDNTTDFFYGKFKKALSDIKIIEFIYKYIDFDNIKKLKLEYMYMDFDEFYEYCMESYDVSYESLYLASNEILYHIQQIKQEFREIVIESIDFNKQFPNIPKLPDSDKYDVPEHMKEGFKYSESMVILKACFENNGKVYFKENVGKAYEDYSWREKELVLLYNTNKSKIDNYTEMVKSYISHNALRT